MQLLRLSYWECSILYFYLLLSCLKACFQLFVKIRSFPAINFMEMLYYFLS